MGVSVDSIHSHANWGRDLGGVSFPLLADFHPKGAVAANFGHYLAEAGLSDRASVLIDGEGQIVWSESVTPAGQRDMDEVLARCESLGAPAGPLPEPSPIPEGTTLFIKSDCGFSRRAMLAIDNLRAATAIEVRNVNEDPSAKSSLLEIGGKDQAPCLVLGGEPLYECDDIVTRLAAIAAPISG